jgi:hypothetical protein
MTHRTRNTVCYMMEHLYQRLFLSREENLSDRKEEKMNVCSAFLSSQIISENVRLSYLLQIF